jgi:hypothetical protein
MEAAGFSETLVPTYKTTRRLIREDCNLHRHCRENLKFHVNGCRLNFKLGVYTEMFRVVLIFIRIESLQVLFHMKKQEKCVNFLKNISSIWSADLLGAAVH